MKGDGDSVAAASWTFPVHLRLRRIAYLAAVSFRRPRKALMVCTLGLAYRCQRLWRRDWIQVSPFVPGRSYSLWKLSRLAGLKLLSDAEAQRTASRRAPLAKFRHRDATWDDAADASMINGLCVDISKSHVDRMFHAVFGYGAQVDPTAHTGLAVRKSEINGTHSGVIVSCPISPETVERGVVYQKLVRNEIDQETVLEYRALIIGFEIYGVFEQRRKIHHRLLGRGSGGGKGSRLRSPEDAFGHAERARIAAFCRTIDLEIGELDILPDFSENRIYIVDANKTPTHMITDRSIRVDRLRILWRWARALRRYLERRDGAGPAT